MDPAWDVLCSHWADGMLVEYMDCVGVDAKDVFRYGLYAVLPSSAEYNSDLIMSYMRTLDATLAKDVIDSCLRQKLLAQKLPDFP